MNLESEILHFEPFSSQNFLEQASELYELQLKYSSVLQQFAKTAHSQESPYSFFPALFFTHHSIYLSDKPASLIFSSSGTSGLSTAKHLIAEPDLYEKSLMLGFELAFPDLPAKRPAILALLPSYLERKDSSLVYMVRNWMEKFGHSESNFFLSDFNSLNRQINSLSERNIPLLIIGVTYALLDFFEQFPITLPKDTLLMETGGMKGRKEEMVRSAVHEQLMECTGLTQISSEYGMTELLSQAYSIGKGRFYTPYWMRVEIRDLNDVNLSVPIGKSGRICIVDLANKWSCAFVATGDIGRSFPDGSFEVLGRADTAGSRGCSLLYVA